jgi:putative transposase
LICSTDEKQALVDLDHTTISLRRQCELLDLNRSTFYYQPAQESAYNLHLMRFIDEQYLATPFYGRRRMTAHLRRQGHEINPKRIRRLMRLTGIEAIYPGPRTSKPAQNHKIYPYLLKNLTISRPDQVWCADITYVPMPHGFMYLVAVMDWFSRFVLAWELSNTLDMSFCLWALEKALLQSQPQIVNTDQGSQFTANAFCQCLLARDIRISMDGRGRFLDNIFIERLWRSLKYECIYLYHFDSVPDLELGLTQYFQFYNHERPHQSFDYRTPAELYLAKSSD